MKRVSRWRPSTGPAVAACIAGLLGACGGRVIFDTASSGAGGATTGANGTTVGTTSSTVAMSASTGMQCLTTATVGGGQGPSTIKMTKCFKPGSPKCPAPANAAPFLSPDPCYAIQSIDDACVEGTLSICCYDVTEELVCDG
jgi:hypothetical protein